MLFATTDMAARIERAEAAVARDFGDAARKRGADVLIAPIGGTAAVYGGPGQPFNKLAGLGFGEPVDEEALARVEAAYDARDAEIRVEQATLADPSIGARLTRRGYALIGYENVLGLALTRAVVDALSRARDDGIAHGLAVSRAGADETRLWVDTTTEGFLHPDRSDGPPPTESFDRDAIRRVFADFSAAPGCTFYLVRRDGEVAGGGSLRLFDGLAQLAGASTLPAHRRRGVQSALLRARLVDAAETGCDLAVVTTEPGSTSQQNVQRAGFALLYARAVLIRPPNCARPVDE